MRNRNSVANTRKDFPDVSNEEARKMRLTYQESLANRYQSAIEDRRIEAGREARRGRLAAASFWLAYNKDDEHRLKRIRNTIAFLKSPQSVRDNFDELRQQARQVPLSRFLAVGRTTCIYHTNGGKCVEVYGHDAHCFSCAKDFDAIAYVMQTENLTFIEAVRRIVT